LLFFNRLREHGATFDILPPPYFCRQ
jgi:hypothetical protein